MNRDILSEILCDDFEILEAPNGPKCLELLNAWGSDISIVLLDIVMPDMDGFDVLSRMSAQGWLEDIPVVMISSEDSSQTVRRAYELGASDYISRPSMPASSTAASPMSPGSTPVSAVSVRWCPNSSMTGRRTTRS